MEELVPLGKRKELIDETSPCKSLEEMLSAYVWKGVENSVSLKTGGEVMWRRNGISFSGKKRN